MVEIAWRCSPSLVEDALDELLALPDQSVAAEESTSRLRRAMRYAVLGGGKRLRSQLVLECAAVVGGGEFQTSRALPAACALELIHAYSLVHDDLPAMDDAATRRGRPSCHREFDEATAILVGDALLTLAFQVLAGGLDSEPAGSEARPATSSEIEARLRATHLLAVAAGEAGMVGGQMIDICWSDEKITGVSGNQLLQMHALKTGALIAASTEIGAVVGGGTSEQIASLRRYGQCVGRAFQIHDDVLDVEGDPQLTGKDATDAANFKTTAAGVFGVACAKQLANEASEEAISALSGFGDEAQALRQLARFVVQREK